MRIGFTFTNYNNSKLSIQAAQSIAASRGACHCEIVIVDNASNDRERPILGEQGVLPAHCKVIWNADNVGYFGGLNTGLTELQKEGNRFDAIVIGNNDLVFEPEFFSALEAEKEKLANYSVVSPDIITLDSVHQNPHVISAVSRFREVIWDLYFLNYAFSRVIGWIARVAGALTARKDFTQHDKEGLIAQGYGACYIITPRFIERYGSLWSPGFVMGEEFYLERQLLVGGERMYYAPKIKVRHHDHATVAQLPSRRLWNMTREYHRIYRFFISPYRPRMDNGRTPADYDRFNCRRLT
jgi:GT2 family glycosyltransferase